MSPILPAIALVWAAGLPAMAAEPLPASTAAFLERNCLGCHDADGKAGGVSLAWSELDWSDAAVAHTLERVQRVVSRGDMPPDSEPRPDAGMKTAFLAWLDDGLVTKVPRRGTPLRRLSRAEYAKTVHGLLGIGANLPGTFPEDTREHGFDNVAEALVISPPLLEAYAEYAVTLADQVFPPPSPPLPPARPYRASMARMSQSESRWGPSVRVVDDALRLVHRDGWSSPTDFKVAARGRYRFHIRAVARNPITDRPMTLELRKETANVYKKWKSFALPVGAVLDETFEDVLLEDEVIRITYADAPNDMPSFDESVNFPASNLRRDILTRFERQPRLLAAWLAIHDEVPAPDGKATTYRLRVPDGLPADVTKVLVTRSLREAMARPDPDLARATPEAAKRLTAAIYPRSRSRIDDETRADLYLQAWSDQTFAAEPAIDLLEFVIEGPFEDLAGEDRRRSLGKRLSNNLLGGPLPATADEAAWLPKGVGTMLTKAFRRPATAEEVRDYVAIAAEHRAAGHSLEQSLHLVLRAILSSPHFIFRENCRDEFTPHDLASRLSYLLTTAPPDGRLLMAANDGSLSKPEVLREHAARLLDAKQASDFIASFVPQWLDTRGIFAISPDPRLGPYEAGYAFLLDKEITQFVETLLRENRPLTDFIDPDFMITNHRVANRFYDLGLAELPREKQWEMQRISIPRGGRVGGLLGLAGVMMATANGVDTHPVVRGKWVLENIVGEPPPPPPPSVPALTPDTRNARTIRELMAAHTKDASCAGCHRKMDPYGLVLENYDAIGRWRDSYPVFTTGADGRTTATPGLPIDAAARLPDDTLLRDVLDLKRHLVARVDQFAGCLAEQLFVFGAGRVPDYAERRELQAAAARVLATKGGFRDLILAVIDTESFRTR
jgi:hypothetical protein